MLPSPFLDERQGRLVDSEGHIAELTRAIICTLLVAIVHGLNCQVPSNLMGNSHASHSVPESFADLHYKGVSCASSFLLENPTAHLSFLICCRWRILGLTRKKNMPLFLT